MHLISESEARELLNQTLICTDCESWFPEKSSPYTQTASAGLTDGEGVRLQLLLELKVLKHPITRVTKYLFTIYSTYTWGKTRIYQLDIKQTVKSIKNSHNLPHEHYGDLRLNGDDSWQFWDYDEVLDYFCQKTGVIFNPKTPSPTTFALK